MVTDIPMLPPSDNNLGWDVSDGADAFPLEPTQWADGDGDGLW